MKVKPPKGRSDKRYKNEVKGGLRKAFARHSVKYWRILQSAKKEEDQFNKDGSLSKKKKVTYQCNVCKGWFPFSKKNKRGVNAQFMKIDHIDPVIPLDKTISDLTVGEIAERQDCDETNLQLICDDCHSEKSVSERKEREKFKIQRVKKMISDSVPKSEVADFFDVKTSTIDRYLKRKD